MMSRRWGFGIYAADGSVRRRRVGRVPRHGLFGRGTTSFVYDRILNNVSYLSRDRCV